MPRSPLTADLVSRPSARAPLARAEREPGPSARSAKRNMVDGRDPSCRLLDPRKSGLPDLRRLTADLGQARDRCLATLARDTRDRRHATRTVGRSLVSRCQTAQSSSFPRRVPASGFVFPLRTRLSPVLRRRTRCNLATPAIPFTPNEGWMERRQGTLLFCRACEARPPSLAARPVP